MTDEAPKEVWFLKMINGEDVFGVLHANEQWLVLENPMQITSYVDSTGNKYMILNRWCPYSAKPVVKVAPAHVMACEPLSEALTKYYWMSLEKHESTIDKTFEQATEVAAKGPDTIEVDEHFNEKASFFPTSKLKN